MKRRRLCMLVPALLTGGCRVPAAGSRMGEVGLPTPESWAGSRNGRAGIDTDWIRSFKSPRLSALVAEALQKNPDLRVASSRVDQARTLVKSTRANAFPQAELRGNGARSKRNFVGFPLGGADAGTAAAQESVLSTEANSYDVSLAMQWEIDVWGRLRAGTGAVIAQMEAVELDYQAARASLASQVAHAWFAMAEAAEQMALATEALQATRDTEAALTDRFQSGQSGEQGSLGAQLRLARADVAAAEAALSQRREAGGPAVRALQLLIGRYPSGKGKDAASLPTLTNPPPSGLPSELLQRRPDILAAERRFAAQGMRKKEARRAVFPRLNLTGSTGRSTDTLENLLNSNFGVWSLGAGLAQTIFTGGKVAAEIAKRSAEENEAAASLQKTVLAAFAEVENALEAELRLRERGSALTEAVRLGVEADSEARANYKQGLGDLLTVLATQNRVVQAKSQLATLKRAQADNRVALHLALGGNFR